VSNSIVSIASHLRTKVRSAVGAFLFLTTMFAARGAEANGALPASLGILVPEDRLQQITLATNFGLIVSEDAGASWQWTCEQVATSMGYLYASAPPPSHRIYGLSPEQGLALSDDGSCSWQRAGGALADAIASDFFVDRTDGRRVLAVAARLTAEGDVTPPAVYASADGGTTFGATPLFTAPAGANIVGVEIARSDPRIIYLAMYTTPDRHPVLLRSGDGGQTWEARDMEAALGPNEFRILTVDPEDAAILYLRVLIPGSVERVAVTRDAGATVAFPIEVTNGTLSGFARLASGTVLVAALNYLEGGGTTGVGYRSTDGGATFGPWTLCPQPHILGLAERAGVLYIAGKNYSDGWSLATSTDEGATITPISTYDQVRGIVACARQTCASTCEFEVSAAVWTHDVCDGTLLDQGVFPPGPEAAGHGRCAGETSSGCSCASGGPDRFATANALGLVLLALGFRWRGRRGRRDLGPIR
jgi:MYXO-CTERM domain-containing protein